MALKYQSAIDKLRKKQQEEDRIKKTNQNPLKTSAYSSVYEKLGKISGTSGSTDDENNVKFFSPNEESKIPSRASALEIMQSRQQREQEQEKTANKVFNDKYLYPQIGLIYMKDKNTTEVPRATSAESFLEKIRTHYNSDDASSKTSNIEEIDVKIDELTRKINNIALYGSENGENKSFLDSVDSIKSAKEKAKENAKTLKDLQKQIDSLNSERNFMLVNAPTLEKFESQTKNEDFSKFSGYDSSYTDTLRKINHPQELNYTMFIYDIVNGNKSKYVDKGNDLGFDVDNNIDNVLGFMTPREVEIFNYTVKKQGLDAGFEYLEALAPYLTVENRNRVEREASEYAKEHPVLSSVKTVVTAPAAGITSAIGTTGDILRNKVLGEGNGINQNSPYNNLTNANSAIRQTVANEIKKNVGGNWGKVGSYAYNLGMSMADSLVNAGLAAVNPALSSAIIGSNAAASTVIAAKDKGLSDDQAFSQGILSGVIEILTEKVSIDALLNKTSLSKSSLGYFVQNIISEGSEEAVSDIANTVADILIAKDKSEWKQSIELWQKLGLSEKDAFIKTFVDEASNVGLDFLGGTISGGLMSGPVAIASSVNTRSNGNAVKNTNSAQSIINVGLKADKNSDSYKLAEKLKSKLDSGTDISVSQLGRLYNLNASDTELAAEQFKAISDNIKSISDAANVISAKANGSEEQNNALVEFVDTVGREANQKNPVNGAIDRIKYMIKLVNNELKSNNADASIKNELTVEKLNLINIDRILRNNRSKIDEALNSIKTKSDANTEFNTSENNDTSSNSAQSEQSDSENIDAGANVYENNDATASNTESSAKTNESRSDVINDKLGIESTGNAAEDAAQLLDKYKGLRGSIDILVKTADEMRNTKDIDFSGEMKYLSELDSEVRKQNAEHIQKKANALGEALRKYGVENVLVDKNITEGIIDGYFDSKDNTIHLSPYISEDAAIGSVVVHEFTHLGAKYDNSLVNSLMEARDVLIKAGKYTDAGEERYRTVYADQIAGKSAEEADSYIREEMAAHLMQNLMEDENVLSALAKENRSLLRRILDFIVDLIDPYGKENRSFQRAADKICSMLENTDKAQSAGVKLSERSGSFNEIQQNIKDNNSKIGNTSEGRKFSMELNVDEASGLFALHNLDEDNFMKSYKLGGLAMPSIAVTSSDVGHSNFGDISLVFSSDTIDPELTSANKVYSADAWTPTFPRIEYEANPKISEKLRNKYYELYKKFGAETALPLYSYGNYFEDALNTDGGVDGIIEKQSSNTKMMQLYLLDQGRQPVEKIYKETKSILPQDLIEQNEFLINKLGEDTINELKTKDGETVMSSRKRWVEEHGDAFKKAYTEYLEQSGKKSDESQAAVGGMTKAQIIQNAIKARNYLINGAETVSREIDTEATDNAIREAVDQNDYVNWLHSLFDGGVKSEGISNGKDPYTRGGNRRSFSATHYPVTLDNIVLSMKSQGEGNTKNASSLFVGSKTIRAESASEYKTLDDIRADKDRLKRRTPEEAKAQWNEFDNRLGDIINRIMEAEGNIDNRFIEADRIGSILAEASRNNTEANIKKVLTEFKLTTAVTADFKSLVNDIKSAPVDIFEAKPERVVNFDEVKYAIIPTDTKADIKNALDELGIEAKTYERGNEAERLDVLNTLSDVRFSKQIQETDSKSFADTSFQQEYESNVDKVLNGKYNSTDPLIIGRTPDVFVKIGMAQLPVTITPNHVYSIAKTEAEAKADGRYNKNTNYHGLGETAVKDIMTEISDPIMVIVSPDQNKVFDKKRNSSHRIIAIVELTVDGKNIIAPIEVNAEIASGTERIDSNLIVSYYERDNISKLISEAIAQETIGETAIYYGIKKRIEDFVKQLGLQLPARFKNISDSDIIIRDISENVNMSIKDVTQSQQFKRWFGDWQNYPETSSKVVNEDGTPKVVYHTTDNDFSIFDKEKSGLMTFGNASSFDVAASASVGFWFNDRNLSNEMYTDRTLECYLDITNPYYTSLEGMFNELYDIPEDADEAEIAYQEGDYDRIREISDSYVLNLKEQGYDGIIVDDSEFGGNSYVVFSPEQIKSATDNIGTFDRNSPDIRYSRELYTSEEKKLIKEKEKTEFFKRQLKARQSGTYAKAVSPSSRGKLAGEIAAELPSVSKFDVNEALIKIYNEFEKSIKDKSKDSVEARVENARKVALDEAKGLIESVWQSNVNPLYEEYTDLRKRIHDTPVNPRGLKEQNSSEYNDIRKSVFGVVNLKNDAQMTVDDFYTDLARSYPEFFKEDITAEADQIDEIARVYRVLQKEGGNPLDVDGNLDDIAKSLADRMVSSYFELSELTYAAKSEQKTKTAEKDLQQQFTQMEGEIVSRDRDIEELKSRAENAENNANKKLEAEKLRFESEYAAFKRDYERQTKKLEKEFEWQNKKLNNILNRDIRKNTKARLEAKRKNALSIYNRMYTMLDKPTKNKNIKENLRAPTLRLLKAIGDTHLLNGKSVTVNQLSAMLDAQEAVNNAIAAIKSNGGNSDKNAKRIELLSEKLEELKINMTRVAQSNLQNRTSEILDNYDVWNISLKDSVELMKAKYQADNAVSINNSELLGFIESVSDIMSMLNREINESNKVFIEGKKVDAQNFADEFISDLSMKHEKLTDTKKSNSDIRRAVRGTIQKYVAPTTFFAMIGDSGKKIIRSYREAQTLQMTRERFFSEYMQKVFGEHYSTADGDYSSKLIDIEIGGKKMQVSRNQLMALYLTWNRPQGRQHLENGGAAFTNSKGETPQSQYIKITEGDYNALIQKLSDKDIKVANAIGKFMSQYCAEWGNEASMQLYGIRLFNEPKYFPIYSTKDSLETNFENVEGYRTITNSAFTHQVNENAKNPIRIMDVFDVVENHVRQMAAYSSYASLNDSLQRVINTNGVKTAVNNYLGTSGFDYLTNFLKTVNLNKTTADSSGLLDWMSKNYKKQAVMANLSTVVKQPLSIFRAGIMIDPKYLIQSHTALIGVTSNYKRDKAEMMKYSGIAYIKDLGYSDTGNAHSLKRTYDNKGNVKITDKVKWTLDSIADKSGALASGADNVTWVRIWNACKLETSDKYKNLSGEAYYKKVAERFGEIIGETQVVDSILDTAPVQNMAYFKMLAPFSNEPIKNLNTFISAFSEFNEARYAKDKKGMNEAGKKVAKTFIAYLIPQVFLEPIISSLFSILRDEEYDDAENVWKKFLKNWIGYESDETTLKSVFTSNAVDGLLSIPGISQIYDLVSNNLQNYDNDIMAVAAVSELLDKMKALATQEGEKTFANKIGELATSAAKFFGVPAYTIKRLINVPVRLGLKFTQHYEGQWEFNKLLYNLENASARNSKNFYDIMLSAYDAGDTEAYKKMRQELNDIVNVGSTGTAAIIKADEIDKAITDRGGKTEVGSDLWYIDVQSRFRLDSYVSDKKVESLLAAVYKKALTEYPDDADSILLDIPAAYSYTSAENGEEIKMSAAEYEDYADNVGQLCYKTLKELTSSSYKQKWAALSMEQQMNVIENIYKCAKAVYKKDYYPEYNIKSQGTWVAELYDSGKVTPSSVARAAINKVVG